MLLGAPQSGAHSACCLFSGCSSGNGKFDELVVTHLDQYPAAARMLHSLGQSSRLRCAVSPDLLKQTHHSLQEMTSRS